MISDLSLKIQGVVKAGYQIASGKAKHSPYERGSIEMQVPYFQERGLDLSEYYLGTLNVDITPYEFTLTSPQWTFYNVQWIGNLQETFSFSRCVLIFNDHAYKSLIYYPHPDTKPAHFQNHSTLEIISPYIEGIQYGDQVELGLNTQEIMLSSK